MSSFGHAHLIYSRRKVSVLRITYGAVLSVNGTKIPRVVFRVIMLNVPARVERFVLRTQICTSTATLHATNQTQTATIINYLY